MLIQKSQKFRVAMQEVVATRNIQVNQDENGYFILNMWTQCNEADINILPVDYVRCSTKQEEYLLKKDNIIIGGIKDICLK